MSYSEVKQLPTAYRRWFLSRLVKEFDSKNKAYESNSGDGNGENMSKLREYENMLSKKT
tara:strand:+ start:304 stop:480 length:177 start_codon:yes stop_codon:yes gene_type:complete